MLYRLSPGEPFTCGVHEIDTLLYGGFPRAALSEIAGAASTNRTALMVSILACAFDTGECCAWIDGGGTFDPESAVEAGLQLNRLLWVNCKGNSEHALKVRVGAAAGEPVEQNNDLFGSTVQLAARLCAHAQPEQILVSNVIAELCLGKGLLFEDLGEVSLKGFGYPVRTHAAAWKQ